MSDPIRHIPAGQGATFDWANDTVRVLSPSALTDGGLTVVQDTLKPGFLLACHHHQKMIEVPHSGRPSHVRVGTTRRSRPRSATPSTLRPGTRHAVSSPEGARIITIFSPRRIRSLPGRREGPGRAPLRDRLRLRRPR